MVVFLLFFFFFFLAQLYPDLRIILLSLTVSLSRPLPASAQGITRPGCESETRACETTQRTPPVISYHFSSKLKKTKEEKGETVMCRRASWRALPVPPVPCFCLLARSKGTARRLGPARETFFPLLEEERERERQGLGLRRHLGPAQRQLQVPAAIRRLSHRSSALH